MAYSFPWGWNVQKHCICHAGDTKATFADILGLDCHQMPHFVLFKLLYGFFSSLLVELHCIQVPCWGNCPDDGMRERSTSSSWEDKKQINLKKAKSGNY